MPKRSRISSRKAGPFSASRMALVATATTSSAPSLVEHFAVDGECFADSSDGGFGEPAGRLDALAEPGDDGAPFELGDVRRRCTSATSSRVELVPRSTTPTRSALSPAAVVPSRLVSGAALGSSATRAPYTPRRARHVEGSPATSPPDRADALADITLPDHDGNEVRLGDLWSDRPVALVWLRHYG